MAWGANKNLVLVAMIFAVAMTFIDQTIVAIAVPELQKDLSMSSTGVQWIINGYLRCSCPAACIAAGLALLVAFVLYKLRTEHPLIRVGIFRDRSFAVDNVVLFLLSMAFVPLFFFASLYAQIGLEQSASEAGLYLLIFFGGFATAAQFGGRILDSRGARPSFVPGALIATAGFVLWARQLPDLDLNSQWPFIVLTGAGMGLMLGPASTDAVNSAPRTSYGEVTGITQTARNFGASLGMALLGTICIAQNKSNVESSLTGAGLPKARADQIADAVSHAGEGRARVSPSGPGRARASCSRRSSRISRSPRAQSSTSWPV